MVALRPIHSPNLPDGLPHAAGGRNRKQEFLAAASNFCNAKLWGTLSATLVIHPKEAKEQREAVDRRVLCCGHPAASCRCWQQGATVADVD